MPSPHLKYLRACLDLAQKSPPRPTNFRVGAILLSRREGDLSYEDDCILSTGYTMELAGNTHAEQCCLANYAAVHSVTDDRVAEVLPVEPGRKLIMYVTMEPCGKRLSGNAPCVQRIINTRRDGRKGIHKVYFGVKEPGTFVGQSVGCQELTAAGIEWGVVQGLEKEILEVALAGHEDREEAIKASLDQVETNLDDISDDERQRQEQMPRNRMKRMMETNQTA
ncbi:cytidine deaminase-like protein [Aspergillus ambiguus]|uniref:putative DRAP deaminase n=1 Tax=Aspergillus ambiguus TaxID=176160 RepID=UPI003CCCB54E